MTRKHISIKPDATAAMLAVIIAFVLGSSVVLGQETCDKLPFEEGIVPYPSAVLGFFRKISSSEVPIDCGNKIVAIRRLTMIVEDIDENKDLITRKLPWVEIELFSKVAVPAVNSFFIVRIGNKHFAPGGKGCGNDGRCTMLVLTVEQFNSLKDGDLISMHNGAFGTPQEVARWYED